MWNRLMLVIIFMIEMIEYLKLLTSYAVNGSLKKTFDEGHEREIEMKI